MITSLSNALKSESPRVRAAAEAAEARLWSVVLSQPGSRISIDDPYCMIAAEGVVKQLRVDVFIKRISAVRRWRGKFIRLFGHKVVLRGEVWE